MVDFVVGQHDFDLTDFSVCCRSPALIVCAKASAMLIASVTKHQQTLFIRCTFVLNVGRMPTTVSLKGSCDGR